MGRIPRGDGLSDLGFIVNYWLTCGPPPIYLHVELSKPPLKRLFLLLLGPDFSDIAEGIYDPRRGRKRKKGRHGRKGRIGLGFPDPNDAVAKRIRGVINPTNHFNDRFAKVVFPIWNIWEGVNFAAAVVDGLIDVHYEHLWGLVNLNPRDCFPFKHLTRLDNGPITSGGAGPLLQSVGIPIVETNNGFFENAFQTSTSLTPFTVNVRMTLRGLRDGDPVEGTVALGPSNLVIKYETGRYALSLGETSSFEIGGDFEPGETAAWGIGRADGFVRVVSAHVTAYSQKPWFG